MWQIRPPTELKPSFWFSVGKKWRCSHSWIQYQRWYIQNPIWVDLDPAYSLKVVSIPLRLQMPGKVPRLQIAIPYQARSLHSGISANTRDSLSKQGLGCLESCSTCKEGFVPSPASRGNSTHSTSMSLPNVLKQTMRTALTQACVATAFMAADLNFRAKMSMYPIPRGFMFHVKLYFNCQSRLGFYSSKSLVQPLDEGFSSQVRNNVFQIC